MNKTPRQPIEDRRAALTDLGERIYQCIGTLERCVDGIAGAIDLLLAMEDVLGSGDDGPSPGAPALSVPARRAA